MNQEFCVNKYYQNNHVLHHYNQQAGLPQKPSKISLDVMIEDKMKQL